MRKALVVGSLILLAGCNMNADARRSEGSEPSGQKAERSFNLSGFRSVAIEGPNDVVVTVGPAFSVRATGDKEMVDRLKLKIEDGNLKVGVERSNFTFRTRGKATVYVTMPAIEGAAIGGSGDMKIDKVAADKFEAAIGGSGSIDIGTMKVGEAEFSIAGSGDIKATGTAGRSSISIAGSGGVDAAKMQANQASISVVGSGDVDAHVLQSADVSVMGSGDVTITGTAKCSVSKMGSGDVRCGA